MYLGWIDYGVLILLLIVSGGIGIYQGFVQSNQTSTKEFLVADGRMKVIRISFVSKKIFILIDFTNSNESIRKSYFCCIITWNACRNILLWNNVCLL
jgi:hypothetical protein